MKYIKVMYLYVRLVWTWQLKKQYTAKDTIHKFSAICISFVCFLLHHNSLLPIVDESSFLRTWSADRIRFFKMKKALLQRKWMKKAGNRIVWCGKKQAWNAFSMKYIDPPGPGRIGGHYFHTCQYFRPSVRPSQKQVTTLKQGTLHGVWWVTKFARLIKF